MLILTFRGGQLRVVGSQLVPGGPDRPPLDSRRELGVQFLVGSVDGGEQNLHPDFGGSQHLLLAGSAVEQGMH